MKRSLVLTGIAALIGLSALLLARGFGNEDAWLCSDGQWVRHGNPSSTFQFTPCGDINPAVVQSIHNELTRLDIRVQKGPQLVAEDIALTPADLAGAQYGPIVTTCALAGYQRSISEAHELYRLEIDPRPTSQPIDTAEVYMSGSDVICAFGTSRSQELDGVYPLLLVPQSNTNVNTNTNSSATACALITDPATCEERTDCLSVDYCYCDTSAEQSAKCGGTGEFQCRCAIGGFKRCQSLSCSDQGGSEATYYQELTNACDNECCRSSVRQMQQAGASLVPTYGCVGTGQPNTLKCAGSYRWCEPAIGGANTNTN